MKQRLHMNQGPLAGQEVELEADRATIENLLDTGYATAVPDPPEPEEEAPVTPAKKTTRPRRRRKPETPEG